jgi:hypothetical protein
VSARLPRPDHHLHETSQRFHAYGVTGLDAAGLSIIFVDG